ncbi:hypothetical protein CC2G_008072 [Coprinopsis cinerea AmutBmut pab1-1]|nr:hypothetical protein CC2G_008072 [Coprinopsis cinerea AmutBmut pab1-1]
MQQFSWASYFLRYFASFRLLFVTHSGACQSINDFIVCIRPGTSCPETPALFKSDSPGPFIESAQDLSTRL